MFVAKHGVDKNIAAEGDAGLIEIYWMLWAVTTSAFHSEKRKGKINISAFRQWNCHTVSF